MKFIIEKATVAELIKSHVSATIVIKDGVDLVIDYNENGDAEVSLVPAKLVAAKTTAKAVAKKEEKAVEVETTEADIEEAPSKPAKKESLKDNPIFNGEHDEIVEDEAPAKPAGNPFSKLITPKNS